MTGVGDMPEVPDGYRLVEASEGLNVQYRVVVERIGLGTMRGVSDWGYEAAIAAAVEYLEHVEQGRRKEIEG